MSEQIAVIGSGIAGLAAAWLLKDRYQVSLIEAGDHIGGHSNTLEVATDQGPLPIDTGFIVYNTRNYPLLVRLFERLGVATEESDMSFSASIDNGRIEYAGDSLNTLFAQRRNLLNPAFLGMIRDMLRFNRDCRARLRNGSFDDLPLGEFLARGRYGAAFRDDYLLPMAAAIWSCPPDTMMAFPARSMANFFNNHGLLSVLERPLWRTVSGGSQRYVARMLEEIGQDRILMDGAQRVHRCSKGLEIELASGRRIQCDRAVIATHADEALSLLTEPSDEERELLGRFRYQPNRTLLHTDTRLMPGLTRVWSSWNYLAGRNQEGQRAVSVTYWMNRLQNLPGPTHYLVSLNPLREPAPETIVKTLCYMHPVFDQPAMQAQLELHRLQDRDRISYCGSYFGYGFHEDALRSAVQAVQGLGIETEWLA